MASTWVFIRGTHDQAIGDTKTTELVDLGTRAYGKDLGSDDRGKAEFIYLTGVASTAVGDWVTYTSDDWTTARVSANGVGPLAVAMSANVANQYGWYMIYGKASANVASSFADNGDVYLTSTAGRVDDADVAGDYVSNALGAGAESSNLADVEIWHPAVQDGKDN